MAATTTTEVVVMPIVAPAPEVIAAACKVETGVTALEPPLTITFHEGALSATAMAALERAIVRNPFVTVRAVAVDAATRQLVALLYAPDLVDVHHQLCGSSSSSGSSGSPWRPTVALADVPPSWAAPTLTPLATGLQLQLGSPVTMQSV